jgi:methylamine dehydrogenase accessory protein MauD
MPSLDIVSHGLLWVVVIVQGILLLALARQIGLLHERLEPSGARIMNVGPQIGQPLPSFEATDIHDRHISLGGERSKRTLLLFISTGCADCAALLPYLKQLARSERDTLEVVLVAFQTSLATAQQYVDKHALDASLSLIVSDELAVRYQVTIAPYALMVDRAGVLRSKGVVNSYSHIESLLTAEELGVRSIQEMMQRRGEMQPG